MENSFLVKSSVAFIGIGQMGGNLVEEFRKLGYTTFYINSSSIDLATIEAKKDQKYQIPLAQGCAKNRELAKDYARQHYQTISTLIDRKLSNFSHIFICFSAGGGTGGGISPTLLANLATEKSEITFGAICALPDIKESLKTKYNACECFKELMSIREILGNIYFIDNNKCYIEGEKRFNLIQLNEIFSQSLNRLLCVSAPNISGIADDQEILTLLSVSGCAVISDILPPDFGEQAGRRVVPILPSADCPPSLKQQFGYCILNDDYFVEDEVETLFGKGVDYFKGYTTGESLVAAFGLEFPSRAIKDLSIQYNEDLKIIRSVQQDDIDLEVMLDQIEDPVKATIDKKNLANKANELITALLIN